MLPTVVNKKPSLDGDFFTCSLNLRSVLECKIYYYLYILRYYFCGLFLGFTWLQGGFTYIFLSSIYCLLIYIIIRIFKSKLIHRNKKLVFISFFILFSYIFSVEIIIWLHLFSLPEPLYAMDGYIKILDVLETEKEKAKKSLDCLERIYEYNYPENSSLTPEQAESRLDTVAAMEVAKSNLNSINRDISSHIRNYRGVS